MESAAFYEERVWDVAIIGAGMGGGFAARALTDAGHDVLVIERGNETIAPARGNADSSDPEVRLDDSRWPTLTAFEIDGVRSRAYAPLGVGVGGSANWYAAALERFAELDLDLRLDPRHPTGGWPVSYAALSPFYEQAERMLHVAGTADPLSGQETPHLREPTPLGPCDTEFMRLFAASGLHPYRLHVGIRYFPGCDECLGRLCYKGCRTDVRSVLAEGRRQPTLLTRSEVTRLESTVDRVTHAVVLCGAQRIQVRAKIFVLAAGAIHTPKLLLDSRSDAWPIGLANHSGLVGRNLMFHATQTFALWPQKKLPSAGPRKSIAFRDFYMTDGERCGCVQSTGFEMGYGELLAHLYRRFDRSAFRRLRFLRPFLRIPAAAAIRMLGRGTIFVCIVEDLPYLRNRVVIDSSQADGIRIEYTIEQELRDRIAHFRSRLRERLKTLRMVYVSQAVELNFGHPCGTCVMSNDRNAGVVDRDCQTHGIANLFVADASIMPTSAGVNPSLTVAANALRVSAEVSRRLLAWSDVDIDAASKCPGAI